MLTMAVWWLLSVRRRISLLSLSWGLFDQIFRRRRWYNHGYELNDEELIRPSLIRECVY